MKKVIVDTDIIISYLRQPRKTTLLKKLIADKALAVCLPAVCLTELYIGQSATQAKQKAKIKRLLKKLKLLLADKSISQKAGELIRHYPGLYLADALVAASALCFKEAELCTFNIRHFEKIENLKIFKD